MIFNKKNNDLFLNRRSVRKKHRKKWLLFVIILFLFFGVIIGSGYFIIYSDYFQVKNLEIRGSQLISNENLLAAITAKMKTGTSWRTFIGPQNILFWKFGSKPVLQAETLPIIADLNIQSDFTGKKVLIQVKERGLFGVWCFSDKNCYAFDADGFIFSAVPEVQGVLILKIEDQNPPPVELDNKILPNDDSIKNLLSTIKIAKEKNIPIAGIKLRESALREWELKTAWGPVIYFSLDFVPENLEIVLANLTQRFDLEKLSYLDFRVRNRIYYR